MSTTEQRLTLFGRSEGLVLPSGMASTKLISVKVPKQLLRFCRRRVKDPAGSWSRRWRKRFPGEISINGHSKRNEVISNLIFYSIFDEIDCLQQRTSTHEAAYSSS